MKILRTLVTAFVFGSGFLAQAQTVQFLIVNKVSDFTQTDNTTTVVAATPYRIEANIEGTGISLAGLGGIAPTISLPGTSSGSNTLTYNAGEGMWQIHNTYSSQGLLDAAYNNGDYSYTILGETVGPFSVTGDSYPSAPLATNLSGGTIVGGVLTWNVAQALTITITGTADHMGIFAFGNSYNGGTDVFGVGSHTFTIPAASLTAGDSYTVELTFDDIVGGTNVFTVGTGALTGAQYAGVYNTTTSFTIQAIPEPSTYAAICGAVALAGVMIRRRLA